MLTVHHVFDYEPTWAPLERLASLLAGRLRIEPPEVESYMYMGVVVGNHEPVTIHLYKHELTRRYLNIDDAGHAYVYRGSIGDDFDEVFYEPLRDLAAAIEHAQGEAKAMRAGLDPRRART